MASHPALLLRVMRQPPASLLRLRACCSCGVNDAPSMLSLAGRNGNARRPVKPSALMRPLTTEFPRALFHLVGSRLRNFADIVGEERPALFNFFQCLCASVTPQLFGGPHRRGTRESSRRQMLPGWTCGNEDNALASPVKGACPYDTAAEAGWSHPFRRIVVQPRGKDVAPTPPQGFRTLQLLDHATQRLRAFPPGPRHPRQRHAKRKRMNAADDTARSLCSFCKVMAMDAREAGAARTTSHPRPGRNDRGSTCRPCPSSAWPAVHRVPGRVEALRQVSVVAGLPPPSCRATGRPAGFRCGMEHRKHASSIPGRGSASPCTSNSCGSRPTTPGTHRSWSVVSVLLHQLFEQVRPAAALFFCATSPHCTQRIVELVGNRSPAASASLTHHTHSNAISFAGLSFRGGGSEHAPRLDVSGAAFLQPAWDPGTRMV